MSMSDPIADLLTRIRNALSAGHTRVDVPASRLKEDICRVLLQEGYIKDYRLVEDSRQGVIEITLKYRSSGKPVIQELHRKSRPSLRAYVKSDEIMPVRSGLGITILTTSRGIMSGKQAREANLGGEVLCEIW